MTTSYTTVRSPASEEKENLLNQVVAAKMMAAACTLFTKVSEIFDRCPNLSLDQWNLEEKGPNAPIMFSIKNQYVQGLISSLKESWGSTRKATNEKNSTKFLVHENGTQILFYITGKCQLQGPQEGSGSRKRFPINHSWVESDAEALLFEINAAIDSLSILDSGNLETDEDCCQLRTDTASSSHQPTSLHLDPNEISSEMVLDSIRKNLRYLNPQQRESLRSDLSMVEGSLNLDTDITAVKAVAQSQNDFPALPVNGSHAEPLGPVSAVLQAGAGMSSHTTSSINIDKDKGKNKDYIIEPIILANQIPVELKKNSAALLSLLQKAKPDVTFTAIQPLKSGDIRVTGASPRDVNVLKQAWPEDPTYGKIIPKLRKERTVQQSVLITNLHPSITEEEIKARLVELGYSPDDVKRFNPSKEPKNNLHPSVKISFGSLDQKERLINESFKIHSQSFKVISFTEDPKILQCFKCQQFGHHFFNCGETKSCCLRCGDDHRIQLCPVALKDAICCNCGKNHQANHHSCEAIKKAVEEIKANERLRATPVAASVRIIPSASQININHPSISALHPKVLLVAIAESMKLLAENLQPKDSFYDSELPFRIASHIGEKFLHLKMSSDEIKETCANPPQQIAWNWITASSNTLQTTRGLGHSINNIH